MIGLDPGALRPPRIATLLLVATFLVSALAHAAPAISTRGAIDLDGRGVSALVVRAANRSGLQAGRLVNGAFQFTALPDPGVDYRVLTIADLDGNGVSDLVYQATNQGEFGEVRVWKDFQPSADRVLRTVKLTWLVQAVGDLDGDGFGDMAFRFTGDSGNPNDTGVSYIWFTDGTNVKQVRKRGGAPLTWSLLGAADINGDGAADMVYVSPDGQIRVLMATSARTCANLSAGGVPSGFFAIALGDFTGQGRGDVLLRNMSSGEVRVLSLDARGVTLPVATANPDDPNASCTSSSLVVATATTTLQSVDATWQLYAVGDFNGDGTYDVIWQAPSGALTVWLTSAQLAQAPTVLSNVGTIPSTYATVLPAGLPPNPPTLLSITAASTALSLSFSAPLPNGSGAATSYTGTCTAGSTSVSASAASSPIVISGLVNGTSYVCSVVASNVSASSSSSNGISATPSAPSIPSSFVVTSSAGSEGAAMSADFTCDGKGSSVPLTWSGAPSGTREYAMLMTTLPGDGTTKWNWILYNIPSTTTGLARDSFGVGALGQGSDGPMVAYQPPCSQGPGAKIYTFTVYALSGSPVLPSSTRPPTGAEVAAAIEPLTLARASLNLTFTRTLTGSSTACLYVRNSMGASNSGSTIVSCDGTFAHINTFGMTTHTTMNGIRATNLQVPIAQNFFGTNAWKIPLAPAIAANTTTAVDGPIGVAINGVPIFNPCKQGGCQNGDTKLLGELDICNGHAGRADDYHYHAAPTCLMAGKPASYWDTHPVGWALDGFAIFGYNNADGSVATRDNICGGNTLPVSNAPAGYSYHVTDVSPYVLSCFRGTPSPDLVGQAAKYSPIRQPPVTPFAVSNMTQTTDSSDGYQVLQFTSSTNFTTTENGNDSYVNVPGTYRIRFKPVTGAALAALLALNQNRNKTACWNFQFTNASGIETQPTVSYCR